MPDSRKGWLLAAVALASLAIGFAASSFAYRHRWLSVSHGPFIERMQHELNLTPQQRDKVLAIINETRSKVMNLREDFQRQRREQMMQARARVRALLTPEQQEAQRATNKNYVTRALGVEQNVEVEIHEQPVQKSDYYVLCSDGLSDMIEDEDIHLTISTFSANLDTVAKQLIQLSNDNGGRDNVSVIMAHVAEPFPAHRRIFDKILGWFG